MKTRVKETLFDEDYWEDILHDAHDHIWCWRTYLLYFSRRFE